MPRVTSSQVISGEAAKMKRRPVRVKAWAYGVMTVPSRRHTLLPTTLASLVEAGFPEPHVYVDGCRDSSLYADLGLPFTLRSDPVRVAGNWTLGVADLYLRNPSADAYVMFQDDIKACRDLRAYLESRDFPARGYYNLYTAYANYRRMSTQGHKRGWYTSNQSGFGALALVIPRELVIDLFTSEYFVTRPADPGGHKSIDGGIISALKPLGYKEYVHLPSLVQHTGAESTLGHVPARNWDKESSCYIGDGVSAMSLL